MGGTKTLGTHKPITVFIYTVQEPGPTAAGNFKHMTPSHAQKQGSEHSSPPIADNMPHPV
jgi:hypothetical protein